MVYFVVHNFLLCELCDSLACSAVEYFPVTGT